MGFRGGGRSYSWRFVVGGSTSPSGSHFDVCLRIYFYLEVQPTIVLVGSRSLHQKLQVISYSIILGCSVPDLEG